jgi:iron complex outermembrane recepter protein
MNAFTSPSSRLARRSICRSSALALGLFAGAGATAHAKGPQPFSTFELAALNASPVVELDRYRVTSDRERPVDATPLKLPTTLHETPRSVSVFDATRLREQNFQTPVDTFFYTPGVFPNSTAGGGYHFIARGFRMAPEDTRVDGFVGFNVGGGQTAQSLYGIDRVVVLRGPAGLLYGAASLPGGMINVITKKPQEIAATRLDVTTSTYAGGGLDAGERLTIGAELDTTGPLTADGRVLYRAIVAGDNAEHFTGDILNRTRFAAASLTFQLDTEGRYTFTPLVQAAKYRRPAGAAMVASPSTSLATNDGLTGPINEGDLSPLGVNLYSGGRDDEMFLAGFDFHGKPSDAFKFYAGHRFISFDTDIDQFTPQVTSAAQRTQLVAQNTVSRTPAKSSTNRDAHNFDVNATYEFAGSGWKNLTQAGFNGRFYNASARTATGSTAAQSPVNIYTGAVTTPLVDTLTTWSAPAIDDDFYWNAYLQNQTSLADNRWVLTLGLGYGQQHYNDDATRKGDVTPNAALVYNVTRHLALYASYSTSYSPTDPDNEDFSGRRGVFDPSTGTNYEAGLKFDLPAQRASVALAVFETRRDNVVVQDTSRGQVNANGNPYFIETEGQRARGVEASGEIELLPAWRVTGTFAWIDASYATGLYPTPVAKTPEYSWSLYNRYDFRQGALKDLGFSLGLVWQDQRMAGNAARTAATPDPLTLPSFLRVDAAVFYRLTNAIDLSLNVQNALDETYFIDGTTGANLLIGAPRTLTLRVGYRF